MSCESPHPTAVNHEGKALVCWHGVGHKGDHGAFHESWPQGPVPVEVILERLEEVRKDLGRPVEFAHDDIDCTAARMVGEIAGLEFALRALGVEP